MPLESTLSEDQHVNSCSTPVLSLWVTYFIAPIEFELHIETQQNSTRGNTTSSERLFRKYSSSHHHFATEVQTR